MREINYQKRKNSELFKSLEKSNTFHLSKLQNYIPIYNRFFQLNNSNYNSINLNNIWYISDLKNSQTNPCLFESTVINMCNQKEKNEMVFFKLAPLLDVCKFLTGFYDVNNNSLFQLPQLNSQPNDCNAKVLDSNNSAYVDGFFVFLTSLLKNEHSFIHGLDYYGSFLAIKNNFIVNIADDLDYLCESDFFNKNKNVLFDIDAHDHLIEDNIKSSLTPIKINHNSSVKSTISIHSLNSDYFGDVFQEPPIKQPIEESIEEPLMEYEIPLNIGFSNNTIKSHSSCSSRTSYSSLASVHSVETKESIKSDDNSSSVENNVDDNSRNINDSENSDENDEDDEDDEDSDDEEVVNVYIKQFPIQIICMENCESTFDDLILDNELTTDEWLSALLQIIMILITYQKAFLFTHNDLHSNNVMYIHTNKKFIYYKYDKNIYKVPTFGRLFKIIDFGRSIYSFRNKLFCSDSFQIGNDAATQYNTEPFFNSNKPRIEPNLSFDLCRFACSIFDCVISGHEMSAKPKHKTNLFNNDPIKKIIFEWCLDDKGQNMMYKANGNERYPDFKLYKMIARNVHNHIPSKQLEREEFKQFLVNPKHLSKIKEIDINIDNIPEFNIN